MAEDSATNVQELLLEIQRLEAENARLRAQQAVVLPEMTSAEAVATPDAGADDLAPITAAEAEALRHSRRPNTLRGYGHDLAHFLLWCDERGYQAPPEAPSTPAAVGEYISHLAFEATKPYSAATIHRRLAAIAFAHRTKGWPSPTRSPRVAEVWRGIRNKLGVRPKSKTPVLAEDMAQMLEGLPATAQGIRDRALLLVGFASGMRSSEIVALDMEDLGFEAEGVRIEIRRSKTDPEGAGQTVGVARIPELPHLCPVAALEAWIALGRPTAGPVFYRLSVAGNRVQTVNNPDGRLTRDYVRKLVKRAVGILGVEPALYGAHSLRSGFVTQAALNDASLFGIAGSTRHKDLNMVHHYMRRARIWDLNPSGHLFSKVKARSSETDVRLIEKNAPSAAPAADRPMDDDRGRSPHVWDHTSDQVMPALHPERYVHAMAAALGEGPPLRHGFVSLCPGCGWAAAEPPASTSPRCPECGSRLGRTQAITHQLPGPADALTRLEDPGRIRGDHWATTVGRVIGQLERLQSQARLEEPLTPGVVARLEELLQRGKRLLSSTPVLPATMRNPPDRKHVDKLARARLLPVLDQLPPPLVTQAQPATSVLSEVQHGGVKALARSILQGVVPAAAAWSTWCWLEEDQGLELSTGRWVAAGIRQLQPEPHAGEALRMCAQLSRRAALHDLSLSPYARDEGRYDPFWSTWQWNAYGALADQVWTLHRQMLLHLHSAAEAIVWAEAEEKAATLAIQVRQAALRTNRSALQVAATWVRKPGRRIDRDWLPLVAYTMATLLRDAQT